jgi:hypothetical protein
MAKNELVEVAASTLKELKDPPDSFIHLASRGHSHSNAEARAGGKGAALPHGCLIGSP